MKYTNFQDIPERMKAYYQLNVKLPTLADKIERYKKSSI